MNANELHHVAEHVRDALVLKQLLRIAVVKAQGGAHVVARFIAREIMQGRRTFRATKETRELTSIAEGYALLKTKLRGIIPETFGWWLEADHDVEIRVRWLWLGHPAVTHSGSVSDCDVTILIALLRYVDWDAEAKEAMASVEETEATLLRNAQNRRRLRLTSSAHMLALPSIESLSPTAPPTFEQKKREMGPWRRPARRQTGEEMEQGLAAAEKPVPKHAAADFDGEDVEREHVASAGSATPQPAESAASVSTAPQPAAPPESKENAPAIVSSKDARRAVPRRGHSAFFLTRVPCLDGPLHLHAWEEFESINEVLAAVRENPPSTYTGAHLYGNHYMKGAQQIWKSFGNGRPYLNAYRGRNPRRELTRREYDRLNTGETREGTQARFSRGR